MSETPRGRGGDGAGRPRKGRMEPLEAMVLAEPELGMWQRLADTLGISLAEAMRIAALSGAEHHLSQLGQTEDAAIAAGMLLLTAARLGLDEVRGEKAVTIETPFPGKKKGGKG